LTDAPESLKCRSSVGTSAAGGRDAPSRRRPNRDRYPRETLRPRLRAHRLLPRLPTLLKGADAGINRGAWCRYNSPVAGIVPLTCAGCGGRETVSLAHIAREKVRLLPRDAICSDVGADPRSPARGATSAADALAGRLGRAEIRRSPENHFGFHSQASSCAFAAGANYEDGGLAGATSSACRSCKPSCVADGPP
jgi:hypothetical protein